MIKLLFSIFSAKSVVDISVNTTLKDQLQQQPRNQQQENFKMQLRAQNISHNKNSKQKQSTKLQVLNNFNNTKNQENYPIKKGLSLREE